MIVGILGLGTFVALVGGGGLMALIMIISAFLGEAPDGTSLLQTVGLAALGIVMGIPLAIVSWYGWREHPARPFDFGSFSG